jgi:hypothetical protein
MKQYILLCSLYIFAGSINAQTTYDVFTYTEPNGFKKEVKTGFISYSKIDSKTGTYCTINLYGQSQSSGDIVKDFNNDWVNLVATPLNINVAPQKDNSDDVTGWKTYSGAANFEFGGGTSMALLTTAKNGTAVANILVITNAQSFLTEVDAFLDKVKLGKPKPVAKTIVSNNKPITPIATTAKSNGKIPLRKGAAIVDFGDYTFETPAYFSKEIKNNIITITEPSEYHQRINILQPFPSSGNLETDLDDYYTKLYEANNWEKANGLFNNSDETEKGFTGDGYEFILLHRDIQPKGGGETEKTSMGLLLIKIGNVVVIITGTNKQVGAAFQYAQYETLQNQYLYILHSFQSKSFKPAAQPINLVGSWSAISSSTGSVYTFHSNGTFDNGSALQTRVGYSNTHDKVTTNSWSNTGKWSLNGNNLTMYINSTKKTSYDSVRMFSVKNYDGSWLPQKLGWMHYYDDGSFGEVGYTKDSK